MKRTPIVVFLIALGIALGIIWWWMDVTSSKYTMPRLPEVKEHESHPMPRVDPDRA